MTVLQIPLPEQLHEQLRAWAEKEKVSIEQLATAAVAEKLSALEQLAYFRERAGRGDRKKFLDAMNRVPDVPPIPPDEPYAGSAS